MTNEEKIQFFDKLQDLYKNYINTQADEDRQPLEFDDEDQDGNRIRRYLETSFRQRQEWAAEELSANAYEIAPFAFDLFDFLAAAVYGIKPDGRNQFVTELKEA